MDKLFMDTLFMCVWMARQRISMDHPDGYAHLLCVWAGGGPFLGYTLHGYALHGYGMFVRVGLHHQIRSSSVWNVCACRPTPSDTLFIALRGYAPSDTHFMPHQIRSSCGPFVGYQEGCSNWIGWHPILMDHTSDTQNYCAYGKGVVHSWDTKKGAPIG
jgi:hypothetical protein